MVMISRPVYRLLARCHGQATASTLRAGMAAGPQSTINGNSNGKTPIIYAWNTQNIQSNGKEPVAAPTQAVGTGDAEQRVYVVGIGNLGRLFAMSLAQLNPRPPITLVVHRETLLMDWLSNPGIRITRNGLTEMNAEFDVEWWTDKAPDVGPVKEATDGIGIRNLLVTTKASDALPEVDRLRRYLNQKSTVVFAQNGLSKLWAPLGPAYVSERYSVGVSATHPNFLACVTRHGVTSSGSFASVHASVADLSIGPVMLNPSTGDDSKYLSGLLSRAPNLTGREVSRKELWVLQLEKLVVNAIINPLTAILRCKNGDLFANPSGVVSQLMDSLVEEASHVLQALVKHESSRNILEEQPKDPSASSSSSS
jgi:2-dehydropantoate 2-reductase